MTLVVSDRVQSVHADRRRMTGDVVGVDAEDCTLSSIPEEVLV